MAGYIFNLDRVDALRNYVGNGVYATKLTQPERGLWKTHHEATFADYATMKAGDNVYFFIERKIYGIGELVNLAGQDCKFSNYPRASEPVPYPHSGNEILLWDEGVHSVNQRWICTFVPAPHFFVSGMDMDDVLASDPAAFRMLRALWKVSFIKFDDEENQAFKNVLLKYNESVLSHPQPGATVFSNNSIACHSQITAKLQKDDYRLEASPFLHSCHEGDYIRHEMAIEAAFLYQLANTHKATTEIFGEWDYVSHQVIASPFKPIDYMDKIDVFGYAYIPNHRPTKSRYLIAELKKDGANVEDVEQAMKYVDWVREEYCHNDYSMIQAYLVCHSFPDKVIEAQRRTAKRQYTMGRRPIRSLEWANLKLVQYRYNTAERLLEFQLVCRPMQCFI